MIKTLTRHGNSSALVIERPIMELLGIEQDTPLKVETDGKRLIIEPMPRGSDRTKFEAAKAKSHARYSKTYRRLAE